MDPPSIVLADWSDGDRLADIPLGTLFDVVRVSHLIGYTVLHELAGRAVSLGPVLHCQPRQCIEFLVPSGTAETWDPMRSVVCAGHGGTLRCPVPGATSRGRAWLLPPYGTGVLTDPGLLRTALEVHTVRGYRL